MAVNLRYNFVTTRKSHTCFGCGRKFEPPCKMVSAAVADGGTETVIIYVKPAPILLRICRAEMSMATAICKMRH